MKATALCLTVLFVVLSGPLATQAEVYIEHSRIVGATAYAEFSYENGDVQTYVSVSVDDSMLLAPPQPGGPDPVRFANVSIFRASSETGEVFFSGGALTEQFEFTIARDLSTARLIANFDVPDLISMTMITVAVDVSWTATGDLVRDKNHTLFRERGFLFNSRSNGISRDAEASGTIEGPNENFIPVPSNAAQIQDNKSGSLTIQIIEP